MIRKQTIFLDASLSNLQKHTAYWAANDIACALCKETGNISVAPKYESVDKQQKDFALIFRNHTVKMDSKNIHSFSNASIAAYRVEFWIRAEECKPKVRHEECHIWLEISFYRKAIQQPFYQMMFRFDPMFGNLDMFAENPETQAA